MQSDQEEGAYDEYERGASVVVVQSSAQIRHAERESRASAQIKRAD
jgi:hypothetical protein